jgi:hypothetical protein
MRSRFTHLACLLLLLSSLAASDARANSVEPTRTPGGVFVRNLLLQAAIEEAEPAAPSFGSRADSTVMVVYTPAPAIARAGIGAAAQTAHVHAVTGNSL